MAVELAWSARRSSGLVHLPEPEHAANFLLEMLKPASLVQILRPEFVVLIIVLTCWIECYL